MITRKRGVFYKGNRPVSDTEQIRCRKIGIPPAYTDVNVYSADDKLQATAIDGNGKKITLPKNKQVSKKIFQNIKIDNNNIPKTSKNSSGYQIKKITSEKNAHKIIIGSEGTLGIIISAKLNILDIPKKRILYIIEYM